MDKYLSYILTFVTPYWDCLCDKFQKQFGNLHIDIFVSPSTLQNFIFPLQKYFEKTKHLWIIRLLCSIIWSQYYFVTITHFSIIFFFSSIQRLREFLEHPSVRSSKNDNFNKNFEKLTSKTSILESVIQVHLQAF